MSNTVTGRDGLMHMVSFESSEQEKNILSPISRFLQSKCSIVKPDPEPFHYPIPPHQQKAYKAWNQDVFPVTEKIHQEVLSLPICSSLLPQSVTKIVDMLNGWK